MSDSEEPRWQAALEQYQLDRLEEAFELIHEQGVGESGRLLQHYRLIEAELLTRRKAIVRDVNPWLSLEYVPSEVMTTALDLPDRVLTACEEIADLLCWQHRLPTRIAILAAETEADWATYPFGYCTAKEPYEKICLPSYLLDDQEEFHRAVAHEYAHVISSNLSDGHAPRWLEEAVSVLAEGSIDVEILLAFRTGDAGWLNAHELERVLEIRGEDEAELDHTLRAYQQCGAIGRYLLSIGGYDMLRELLVEHANDHVIRNLKLRVLGLDRIDGAVRTVYHQTLPQVFDNALRFLLNT